MTHSTPLISVVIPTYQRASNLRPCLEALKNLHDKSGTFEVIIVDDGSEQSPELVVNEFADHMNIRCLVRPHEGVSVARNAGAEKARGRFLAFIGDDCIVSTDWLEAFTANAGDSVLGGGIDNGFPDSALTQATHLLIEHICRYSPSVNDNLRFFTPNNMLVPIDSFREVGGFDPIFHWSTGEDRDFCSRLADIGVKLNDCPEARVTHYHRLSLTGFFRTHWRYGIGSYHFRKRRITRTDRRFFTHPLSFYGSLILAPLKDGGIKSLHLSMLLALSQAINASAMVWAWSADRLVKNDRPD